MTEQQQHDKQLAYKGWHQVSRQEELLTAGGEEVGGSKTEGLPTIGDGGQAAISFTPYMTGHANTRLHF